MVGPRWTKSQGPPRSCAARRLHCPRWIQRSRRNLVSIADAELRFRHPLVRSAVRQAAPPVRVLEMYGALAKVVADPERRLWHRAMAAVGYDEELAAALEAHAALARRRGAVAVAAAALERAAALTAAPARKGERLVRAAEVAYELGLVETARGLLQRVKPVEVGSLEVARSAWLQHMISGDVWVQSGAAKTFVAIATQMVSGGDADMALRSLVPIAHRCWWTRPRARTREYVVDAARELWRARRRSASARRDRARPSGTDGAEGSGACLAHEAGRGR